MPRVEAPQHLHHLVAAQALELDPLEPLLASQELQDLRKCVLPAACIRRRFFRTVGADEEHAASADAPRDEVEEAHRSLVRPLEIFEHEHQGTLLRDEGNHLVQDLPELLFARGSVRGEGEAKEPAQDGNGAGESRRAVEEEALERGRGVHAAECEVLAERVRDREVGASAAPEETRGDEHARAVAAAGAIEFLHEPALPDAGFTGDADRGAFSQAHLAVEGREPRRRPLPPHHRGQEALAPRGEHLVRGDQVQLLMDAGAAHAVVFPKTVEILGHFGSDLIAIVHVLHHRLEDDVLEIRGNLGHELPDRDRVLVQDRVRHRHRLIADEGKLPRQELVHENAEREEIGPAVHLLAGHLLRGHVGRGSHDGSALRDRAPARDLGKTEVHHLDPALGRALDVRPLDVPVHDSVGMGLAKRIQDLEAQVHDLVPGEGSLLDQLAEGRAGDVFHGEEDVVAVGAHFVDHRGVGMIQRCRRAPLIQKAATGFGILGELLRKKLQGRAAVEQAVGRKVHDPHPTLSERGLDLVMADVRRAGLHPTPRSGRTTGGRVLGPSRAGV